MVTADRIDRIIETACRTTESQTTFSHLNNIGIHHGYSEDGYVDPECGSVLTGNWNGDKVMARVIERFEKLGVPIEWSDEWTTCNECGKLVRVAPSDYGWQPGYYMFEDYNLVCKYCIKDSESLRQDMYSELEADHDRALTFGLDIEADGYRFLDKVYESGMYGIRNDPKKISAELNVPHFFCIYAQGQFAIEFQVAIRRAS